MACWRRQAGFESGPLLRGLQAMAECTGGLLLTLLSDPALVHIAGRLTRAELAEDPHDAMASHLMLWVSHVSTGSKLLFGLYLLGHGLTRMILLVALLRRQHSASPVAVAARDWLY